MQDLNEKIKFGVESIKNIKEKMKILAQHEKEIKDNKNFYYIERELYQKKIPLMKGVQATTCILLNEYF